MVDERLKYQLIEAYAKCQNLSEVARRFKVDRRTVRLWVKRYKETSNVCARPRSGRPASLNGSGAMKAKELLTSGKYSSAKDVANELFRMGVSRGATAIQASTVIKHARAAAKAAGKPIQFTRKFPAKRLTPHTQQQRLAFCKANKDTIWANVMFSDRSKHHFWYHGEVVHTSGQWCEHGQQPQAFKVNKPACVNLYAGITRWGATKVQCVAGTTHMVSKFHNKKGQPARNITSSEYKQVLMTTLLPGGSSLFSEKGFTEWFLQQDNDPTHKKAAKEAIEEWNNGLGKKYGTKVKLLMNYPPHSPDLNPIENLWAKVQKDVAAAGCKDSQQFKATVINGVEKGDRTYFRALVGSMPKRINACITANGGKDQILTYCVYVMSWCLWYSVRLKIWVWCNCLHSIFEKYMSNKIC